MFAQSIFQFSGFLSRGEWLINETIGDIAENVIPDKIAPATIEDLDGDF